jgi:hypothetical protein
MKSSNPIPLDICIALLTNCLYSPLWALASCTNSLQASLSIAVDLQSLTFNTLRSSLTSSNHLNLSLHLTLLVWIFSYKIFRVILLASILSTCSSQSTLTCRYKSNYIYTSFFSISAISSLFLILHYSSGFIGPYIFLIIFLSNLLKFFSSSFFNTRVSLLYVTTGCIHVL